MFTNYIHIFYIQKIYTFCIPNFIYTDIRIYPKYPKYPKISKLYPKISELFIIIYGIRLLNIYIFTTVF